jgi:hypothetical protein
MSAGSLLAGIAGEYFVAGELSRRGWVASLTLRNTQGIDIVATNPTATKTVTIQCKSSRARSKRWILSEKSERFVAPNHFYVFIDLRGEHERPLYYIVPSTVVAQTIAKGHRDWLRGMTRTGKPRKDSSVRQFEAAKENYLERWDLLGL